MRLHLFSLTALTLPACSGGTTGDSGVGDDSDADTDVPAEPYDDRDEVLIFHGRGGVGPEGTWGYVTHDETIALLAPEGLTVEHKDSWPGSVVATTSGACQVAVRGHGDGFLVLMHDSQILENYDTWDDNGMDNTAFLWNLTRLGWSLGSGGPPERE